jgi:TRAP-type C4-dicarboxylate transport system substrate-binding protein
VFDAVGIFDTPEQSVKVLQDPEIHKLISSYGTSKGVETISVFWHSPLALMTKKAVRTPADFAGLKLRTPGGAPLAIKPVEKLKASPISMPINDALPALQNGAIDGIISGSTVAATLKYYDVAKYMTLLPKSMIFVSAVVNGEFMKKIGPELAAIVREEAMKAELPAVKWGVADAQSALDVWKKNGGEVIAMTGKAGDDYLAEITEVGRSVLSQNAAAIADYDKLVAASKKYR